MIPEVRQSCPRTPLLVGGGVDHRSVAEFLREVDAVIVGSALEERPFTGPVSLEKAKSFVYAARNQ